MTPRTALPALALLSTAVPSPAQQYEALRGMTPRDLNGGKDIAAADLDGDGDLDAFVFGFLGNVILRNDGSGDFEPWPPAVDLGYAYDGDLGDVDGDGDVDAAAMRFGTHALFRNDGAGNFSEEPLPGASSQAESLVFGNVDGDGDLDILIGEKTVITLLTNDGAGNFTDDSANVPPLPTIQRVLDMALGDVDGDGDADLLAAVGDEEDENELLLGDGTGHFTLAPGGLPTPMRDTRGAELVDVNGDGDLDAVFGNYSGPDHLLHNDGTGAFTLEDLPTSGSGTATESVAVGDVEDDGDADLFFGRVNGNGLLVNDGAGVFTDAAQQLPAPRHFADGCAFADVDGDDDTDLLLTSASPTRLYLNDGSGTFTDTPMGMPDEPSHQDVAAADVDGDDDVDVFLLTAGSSTGFERLYLNDGSGVFFDSSASVSSDVTVAGAVALGDVDGDGDPDAVLGGASCSDAKDGLLLNDGAGLFTPAEGHLPGREALTEDVALGDVDGDGDLDAVMGNDGGCTFLDEQNYLYENDGSGVFTDATGQLPVDFDDTQAIALADVDGDGDLDLALGNGRPTHSLGQQLNRLYANDGNGDFTDAPGAFPAQLEITVAVATGDVDADGDLDVLFGNAGFGSNGAPDVLLVNDGGGNFSDGSAALPSGDDLTETVALEDLDGDGDLDAWIGTRFQDRVWTNDGAGTFSDLAGSFPDEGTSTRAMTVADFDRDGDLDLFPVAHGNVLFDVTRQLSRRALPRVGKPLDLDLAGPAQEPWVLLRSFGAAEIPLFPYGTLFLDPLTLVVETSGVLDGGGEATVQFPVPGNAVLVGFSVYWQAALGASFQLSNLEITTLTAF